MLDIDTAIKHCLEVAEENDLAAGTYEILAENNHNAYERLTAETNSSRCAECAADHRQLAEWLTELKELRRLVDLVAKYAGNSEDVCERYLPSINGDLCVTDGMGASDCTCCGYEYRCDYKTDIGLLEDVETSTNTDVQAVKRGYWEEVTDYGGWGDTHYRCSVCGEEWYLEDGKPKDNNMNFCPRCGARMDGDTDA